MTINYQGSRFSPTIYKEKLKAEKVVGYYGNNQVLAGNYHMIKHYRSHSIIL